MSFNSFKWSLRRSDSDLFSVELFWEQLKTVRLGINPTGKIKDVNNVFYS